MACGHLLSFSVGTPDLDTGTAIIMLCFSSSCCFQLPPKCSRNAVKVAKRKQDKLHSFLTPRLHHCHSSHVLLFVPNCCLPACTNPSIHVTFVNIFCGMHLHNIPPDLKIAEDMIDFWVASLTQPKPLLLRGSECVTQDYTIHCESESGRLCFGMYGGGKG